MVAVCGLDCSKCGAFLATKENDDQKRAEVGHDWSRLFKVEVEPEDINCDGCLSDGGRVFNYCKVCEITKCGKEKVDSILYSETPQMLRIDWMKLTPPLYDPSHFSFPKAKRVFPICPLERI